MRNPQPKRSSTDDLWLFAYGSLIWRPAFAFLEKRVGHVEDHGRRFYQASTDHRGTLARPGRVVTLVPRAGEVCGGVLYRIAAAAAASTLAELDHREQQGYRQAVLAVTLRDSATTVDAVTYVADADNPSFAPSADLDEIVAIVARAAGPSGRNRDYVTRLAAALRALEIDDAHVFELAARLG